MMDKGKPKVCLYHSFSQCLCTPVHSSGKEERLQGDREVIGDPRENDITEIQGEGNFKQGVIIVKEAAKGPFLQYLLIRMSVDYGKG